MLCIIQKYRDLYVQYIVTSSAGFQIFKFVVGVDAAVVV